MLASVVVTNFNYERYVGAAIDSALAQTYPLVEVVVVDDGSTDGSRQLIASYGERIVPVLKDNGGQASAFNAGFAASRGEVVVFLDADDLLLPSAIETAAAYLADRRVVKVHWPLSIVDAHGRPTGGVYPREALPEGDWSETVLRDGPSSCPSPPTTGNAWSRRFLSRVLPMPEQELRINADAYLFGVAPVFGLIRKAQEPLACYRVHGRSYYLATSFEERIRTGVAAHDAQCRALAAFCRREEFPADPQRWRNRSWFCRVQHAIDEIQRRVAPAEAFILIDEDQWGTEDTVAARRRLHLLEAGGRYWGPPADDEQAIAELERLRTAGARWIVFADHTFWWLKHYAGLTRHLQTHYRCDLDSEVVKIFDLRQAQHSRA